VKTRKQGSTEAFTGQCIDENGVANLTGSTLTIRMRDQFGALIINDLPATILAATSGTWTYDPLPAHVATQGVFQIEITETRSSGKVVRYPQSGYEPLIIEPKLDATGVAPPNPTNNSITLAMMQQQTPGAVLLYDAGGNAIAYAPVAAGRVLTDNGPGLPPTWQASGAKVLIDSQSLAASALYTSPTWPAGTYRRVWGVIRSTFTYVRVRFAPGFAASTGRTAGTRVAATAFSDTNDMYLHFGASSPEVGVISFELFPIKDGAPRGGNSRSSAVDVATGLVVNACNFNIQNSDVATDITGILIDFVTTNATGTIRLYGETT
jgi:hypothetical protein